MQKNNLSTFLYKSLFLLSIPAVCYILIGFYHSFHQFGDGQLRWAECAYLLRGIYPMDIIKNRVDPIPSIGSLPPDATTTPWSYLLSNLFYPGMFDYRIAAVWAACIFILSLLFICIFIYKRFRMLSFQKKDCILPVIVLLSHYGWESAVSKLNNGMFITVSLILIVLICEYLPKTLLADISIGFLLTVAMIKPQTALLFYIPLLFQKRYKPILFSISSILILWGSVSVISQVDPLTIFFEQFTMGVSLNDISSHVYYGLFHFLLSYGLSSTALLLLEMSTFSILALFLGHHLKKSSCWAQFSVPAVFSTMWCYNHNMDLAILCIATISCVLIFIKLPNLNFITRLFIVFFCFFNALPIPHSFYAISQLIPFMQRIIYAAGLFLILKYQHVFPATSFNNPSKKY